MIKRKSHLIEALIDRAFSRTTIGSPDARQVQKLIEQGAEWPDSLKPGAMILALPENQREMLKTLTADDLNPRLDSIYQWAHR